MLYVSNNYVASEKALKMTTNFNMNTLNTFDYIKHVVARILQGKEFHNDITSQYDILHCPPGVTLIVVKYTHVPAYSHVSIQVPDAAYTNFLNVELPNILINTRIGFITFMNRPEPHLVPFEHSMHHSQQFYITQYNYRAAHKEPPLLPPPVLAQHPTLPSPLACPPTIADSRVFPVSAPLRFTMPPPPYTAAPSTSHTTTDPGIPATYTPTAALSLSSSTPQQDESKQPADSKPY